MSNVEHDDPLHPQDVRDDSVWDESPAPAFDNDEATDVLNDGHEDPLDVIEKSPGEQAVKKKSSAAFYTAVGAFALVAAGVVGFKAGLFRPFTSSDARPSASVMPMANDPLPKPEANASAASLLQTVNPPASADVFASAGGASTLGRGLEADAAALGVAGTPVGSTGAKVPEAAEQPATTAPVGTPVSSTASAETSMLAEPAAPSAPSVASLAQVVPQAAPLAPAVSLPAAAPATVMPATASAGKAPRAARAVAASRQASKAKAPMVASAPGEGAASRVKQVPSTRRAQASTKVAKRTPMRDDRADSKEILSGWKLRGTWPQRGPGQLAWIADAKGTLTTVAVGQRVGGAEVLLIGKRGEMVQTTAGQILP